MVQSRPKISDVQLSVSKLYRMVGMLSMLLSARRSAWASSTCFRAYILMFDTRLWFIIELLDPVSVEEVL